MKNKPGDLSHKKRRNILNKRQKRLLPTWSRNWGHLLRWLRLHPLFAVSRFCCLSTSENKFQNTIEGFEQKYRVREFACIRHCAGFELLYWRYKKRDIFFWEMFLLPSPPWYNLEMPCLHLNGMLVCLYFYLRFVWEQSLHLWCRSKEASRRPTPHSCISPCVQFTRDFT